MVFRNKFALTISLFLGLFVGMIMLPFFSYSQPNSNKISIAPFQIWDSENPSLRLRYEKILFQNYSILVGAGWSYTLRDRDSMSKSNSENFGYILSSEIRRYVDLDDQNPLYIGIRVSHLNSDHTKVYGFKTDPASNVSIDLFRALRLQKKITSIMIISGLGMTLENNLYLDFELGIGTANRTVDLQYYPEDWGFPVFDRDSRAVRSNKEYNGFFTPFPFLQINVGYSF